MFSVLYFIKKVKENLLKFFIFISKHRFTQRHEDEEKWCACYHAYVEKALNDVTNTNKSCYKQKLEIFAGTKLPNDSAYGKGCIRYATENSGCNQILQIFVMRAVERQKHIPVYIGRKELMQNLQNCIRSSSYQFFYWVKHSKG